MMQYQLQVTSIVVIVIFVAILAQLELDSEPLIAKRTVTLSTGKDETFRMITDLHKFQTWMSLVEQVSDLPYHSSSEKVGRPFMLYVSTAFVTLEMDAKITRYEPISTFEYEARSALVTARLLYSIEDGDMDGFSRLTLRMYSKRRSYLYLLTVVQPMKFILSQHVTASLFNLKVLLQ